MKSLTDLVKERPVIYCVLGHYLHNTLESIRKEQDMLYSIVSTIRYALKTTDLIKKYNPKIYDEKIYDSIPSIPLTDDMKIIIYISALATQHWLRTNPYHAWVKPIIRLLRVIDDNPYINSNIIPEPRGDIDL